jgi:hypothetical protein
MWSMTLEDLKRRFLNNYNYINIFYLVKIRRQSPLKNHCYDLYIDIKLYSDKSIFVSFDVLSTKRTFWVCI